MATGPRVFAVEEVAGCLVDVRSMPKHGGHRSGSMEWVAEEVVEGCGDGFRLVEVWDMSGVRDDGEVPVGHLGGELAGDVGTCQGVVVSADEERGHRKRHQGGLQAQLRAPSSDGGDGLYDRSVRVGGSGQVDPEQCHLEEVGGDAFGVRQIDAEGPLAQDLRVPELDPGDQGPDSWGGPELEEQAGPGEQAAG
jgi:hypothetical protein